MRNRIEPAACIEPTAIYFFRDVQRLLKLSKRCVSAEVASGRLRVSTAHGRYRFLGAWLLEWIQAGETGKLAAATEGSE